MNTSYSVVKISDEVPRDDNATVNTVVYTSGLDEVFRNNSKEDPLLRYGVRSKEYYFKIGTLYQEFK